MTETVVQDDLAVRLAGISKAYGGTSALVDVDMEIRRGGVHALLGGNGSGKSTLIKILAGVVPGESGHIEVGGVRHGAAHMTPELSARLGFRFVHQDLALVDDLTVAENVALVAGYPTATLGRIDWDALNRRAQEVLTRFEVDVDPSCLVQDLSPAQRTMVAVARSLAGTGQDTSVLVLDEPTASLPDHEVEILLSYLRRRAMSGDTIVYVSHRLQEIATIADDVTVLRDGRRVATIPAAEASERQLVEMIAGRSVDRLYPDRSNVEISDEEVVRVDDLVAGRLEHVSLSVRRNEVVGIAGLLGAGKTTLLRTIFGVGPRDATGTITLLGEPLDGAHVVDCMRAGVAYVPEERARDALLPDLSVRENLSVAALETHRAWGAVDRGSEGRSTSRLIDAFRVKTASAEQPVATLSGGNQQKTILARWMQRDPALILLDEPTQGVDVVTRADIYELLDVAARRGAGVLLASSDHEELAHVCDRIIVLRTGRVAANVPTSQIDAAGIVALTYHETDTP